MTTTPRLILAEALCQYSGEGATTIFDRLDGLMAGLDATTQLRLSSSIDDEAGAVLAHEYKQLAGALHRMTRQGLLPSWLLNLEAMRLFREGLSSPAPLSTREGVA